MSKAGEIKIINKLLQDLTQYSSIKLFEAALDEVMESYGNRNEMYKVLDLDQDAVKNWERQINNCYHILTGLEMVAKTGDEKVEESSDEEFLPPAKSVSAYKSIQPSLAVETPEQRRKRLEQEFFDVFGV
jgi:hypothetical protein